MRQQIIITPELIDKMEKAVRNSPEYQAKITEAKAHLERSKESLRKFLPCLK